MSCVNLFYEFFDLERPFLVMLIVVVRLGITFIVLSLTLILRFRLVTESMILLSAHFLPSILFSGHRLPINLDLRFHKRNLDFEFGFL